MKVCIPLVASLIFLGGCSFTATTIERKPPVISQVSGNVVCEDLYQEIDNDLENANYCNVKDDCVMLVEGIGDFGCYRLINKEVDQKQLYEKIGTYNTKCDRGIGAIKDCNIYVKLTCIDHRCTTRE